MVHFEIKNLNFSYPGQDRKVLQDIDLTIQKGEYVVICGASGSGKTTLLRQLKTQLAPHGNKSGQILFCGMPLADQAEKIGYVMQDPDDQIVTDKVWHELAFGLESIGCDQQIMRSRVAEMACYFGIADWFHKDVATLSGGQKQLLNLASIMAMQPEVLILDEPTSQLDPLAASDFLNTVRKINTELGTTVIITEHRLEDIFPYADRAVVMEAGRIVANDTPRNIGRLLFAQKSPMFAAMPTPVRVACQVTGEEDCPLTVREGRTWLSEYCPEPRVRTLPEEDIRREEPVVSAKGLWFRYEKNAPDVLQDTSAEIPAGSLYAIVGGNGAGKSTFLKAICGICRPYRGKIKVFGKPVEKYKTAELFGNCVAMLPQDPKSLFVKNTVEEELLEMTAQTHKIREIAELCGVEHLLKSHPYDLSGGEQQRVALAKVLLTDPRILLLDEPTKGIDNFFKEKLAEIFHSLKAKGVTIIMVSHDVEFCARYADQVSMFFDGQILTTNTPRRFFGSNSFYTTAANRMSRHVFFMAVTGEDVVALCRKNQEETT